MKSRLINFTKKIVSKREFRKNINQKVIQKYLSNNYGK